MVYKPFHEHILLHPRVTRVVYHPRVWGTLNRLVQWFPGMARFGSVINRVVFYTGMCVSFPYAFKLTTSAFSRSSDFPTFANAIFAVFGGLAGLCFTYVTVIIETRYERLRNRVVAAGERFAFAAIVVLFSSILRYSAASSPGGSGLVPILSGVLFGLAMLSAYVGMWRLGGALFARTMDYDPSCGIYRTPAQWHEHWAALYQAAIDDQRGEQELQGQRRELEALQREIASLRERAEENARLADERAPGRDLERAVGGGRLVY